MKKIILLVILYSLNVQCQIFDSPYPGYRFSNFDNTPASDLAKAVKEENIKKISKIIKVNPELIEYQDPIWGMNLLCLSIVNNKREAFKALLANGANVDGVCGKRDVTTPLIAAINYLDNCDAFFIKELLKNNCDVNLKAVTINEKGLIAEDLPLFSSVDARTNKGEVCAEISRILINNGANLNVTIQRFPYKKPFTIVDVSLKYLDFDLLLYLFSEDKIEIPEFIEHETIEGITKVDFIEYLNFDKFTNVGSSEFQIKREKLIELIKEKQKK